uniref:profilin-1 n=1 Tax=Semicossyphus pulcher TaxID=241346 RepID=UPI0037E89455
MADPWKAYIDNLLAADSQGQYLVENAAICGYAPGQESVWSSTKNLSNISVIEIKKLANDRSSFPIEGAFVGGQKCRLLRDQMEEDNVYACDMKTAADADGNTINVCVGKTTKALIIAFGKKDVGGGQLRAKVYAVVKYLRDSNM